MISIVNKGPYDDPDPGGERIYEVRINSTLIVSFQHCRRDGLAVCLRKAAEAVQEAEYRKLVGLMQEKQHGEADLSR